MLLTYLSGKTDLTAALEKVVVTMGYTSLKPEQENAICFAGCSCEWSWSYGPDSWVQVTFYLYQSRTVTNNDWMDSFQSPSKKCYMPLSCYLTLCIIRLFITWLLQFHHANFVNNSFPKHSLLVERLRTQDQSVKNWEYSKNINTIKFRLWGNTRYVLDYKKTV